MQASDEQDGNKGLLKAELESIFGKPKPIVVGSHQLKELESYAFLVFSNLLHAAITQQCTMWCLPLIC